MHESSSTTADRLTTRSELRLAIRREQSTVQLRFESEFVESLPAHTPISMRALQALGTTPTTTAYTFTERDVEVVTTTDGRTAQRREPLPSGRWLTPAQASDSASAALHAGDKQFTLRFIDPASGLEPITSTTSILERTTVEALGRTVPAVKWSMTADRYPGVASIEFVDESARAIRSETRLGDLNLVVLLADRDLATAPGDPPELLTSTLVTPGRPIARPRSTTSATFLVRTTQDQLPDLPTAGFQTAQRIDPRTVRIRVDLARAAPAPPGDVQDGAFRAASAMIERDDPEVMALRYKVQPAHTRPLPTMLAASRLRQLVHDQIRAKNLDVGFASAAQVARTRTGDCTEHAVLLAALLRAAGIPSRVVSGLVYVEHPGRPGAPSSGVFGYHMWTQALIESDGPPRWIDLDATLPGPSDFDAAHIALLTSSFADGAMTNDLVRLTPLIGTLRIDVEPADDATPQDPRHNAP